MGKASLHGHDDLVPVKGTIVGQRCKRAGDQEIAALQLGFPDKDAAVGIRARTELELQDEITGKEPGGPQLPVVLPGMGDGHDQAAVPDKVAAVVRRALRFH